MQVQGDIKILSQVFEQKRLNSVAQATRQVALRFPLSTAAEADIAVHTAADSDTALTSGNSAWPLGNGPGAGELCRIVGRVPQACQFSAECRSEPLSFRFGLRQTVHNFGIALRWPILLSAMRGLLPGIYSSIVPWGDSLGKSTRKHKRPYVAAFITPGRFHLHHLSPSRLYYLPYSGSEPGHMTPQWPHATMPAKILQCTPGEKIRFSPFPVSCLS